MVDASSNKIAKLNQKIIKRYKNVRYFKQKSTRITRGCFEVLKYLKYDIVTFLYDDDIMGPYVFKIYKNFFKNKIFSMGTGIVLDQKFSKFKFNKLKKFKSIKKCFVIKLFWFTIKQI